MENYLKELEKIRTVGEPDILNLMVFLDEFKSRQDIDFGYPSAHFLKGIRIDVMDRFLTTYFVLHFYDDKVCLLGSDIEFTDYRQIHGIIDYFKTIEL